jgi:hypothetical protein
MKADRCFRASSIAATIATRKGKPSAGAPHRATFTVTLALDLDSEPSSPRSKPEAWHADIKKALLTVCREHRRPAISIVNARANS